MIDWTYVATSSLWIVGLSIVLAVVSYYDWWARETGQPRREAVAQAGWSLWFSFGMLLVALGFGLGRSARWWERALWGGVGVWFAWRSVGGFRDARRSGRRDGEQGVP